MAIKKNRKEKGRREDLFGSNPHSKGEHFSRSAMVFFERYEANIITTLEINRINEAIVNNEKIIYTKLN